MHFHEGRLEVITGEMFAGKTEELLKRLKHAVLAKQDVRVFKSSVDNRYGIDKVVSHNGTSIKAVAVKESQDIAKLAGPATVIGIDEAQFFDDDQIVRVVDSLVVQGKRVIVAGLDNDFRGMPFGSMPELLCMATEVTKLHAICVVCGENACRTQRLVNGEPAHYDDPIIVVGASEKYEARCITHHVVPRK